VHVCVLLKGKYLVLTVYPWSHTFLKFESSILDLTIKIHMGWEGLIAKLTNREPESKMHLKLMFQI
jgi:hypothetical protein